MGDLVGVIDPKPLNGNQLVCHRGDRVSMRGTEGNLKAYLIDLGLEMFHRRVFASGLAFDKKSRGRWVRRRHGRERCPQVHEG